MYSPNKIPKSYAHSQAFRVHLLIFFAGLGGITLLASSAFASLGAQTPSGAQQDSLSSGKSVLSNPEAKKSQGISPTCQVNRPLVSLYDPAENVVRNIPAVVPPPPCLSPKERALHEKQNAKLQALFDRFGNIAPVKIQPTLKKGTRKTPRAANPRAYRVQAPQVAFADRIETITQGSVSVTIGYDAAGHRTSVTYSNGTSANYTYNAAGRLTQLVHLGPGGVIESLTYSHDATGNPISVTRSNGAPTALPDALHATYDAANQQIKFNNAAENLKYDANGNLIQDLATNTTYTWDARNRLVAISGPSLSASFQYDALGRRVSKTINGVTTECLYDGNSIAAEIQGGAVVATYLRHPKYPDDVFVRTSPGGNEYYHADALGSTLALTDDSGAVKTRYTYGPYGATIVTGSQSSNPFQYTGRENDGTGLYYYRARYYSPKLHRFLSEDPIRFGRNHYSYARLNPLRYTDPSGLRPYVDAYASRDSAARHALADVAAIQGSLNYEYGGRIYQRDDGLYSYTEPDTQYNPSGVDLGPIPRGGVASYHNHPILDDVDEEDKVRSRLERLCDYVGTPIGRVLEFNPKTGQTTDVTRQISRPEPPCRIK